MKLFRIIKILPARVFGWISKFISDFVFLFKPNKLFIYSWMQYKGSKLLHFNWGDDINKYFIESISNLNVLDLSCSSFYKLLPVKAYSCIGSILGIFNAGEYEVWGSGLIEPDFQLKSLPKKIHSVRGPLTRQALLNKGIECPPKYGDPALLISRYYRKDVDKQYQWGIIPHYVDEDNSLFIEFCQQHPEVLVIRMHDYEDWLDIPDKILQCHRIMSSSLHGLIIADSYGIPNVWLRFSNKIQGGNFKYLDYFQSVNRPISSPVIIESARDIERVMRDREKATCACNIDFRGIFESCPFKNQLFDYEDQLP